MRRRIACTLALTGLAFAAVPSASAAETWQQTSRQTYYLTDALQRSQGIATDGTTWYFSWKLGLLYASSNNDAKSIYRIDPDTGQVTDVFDRASSLPSGSETEGLAFLPTSDGAQMHALDAVSGRLATYLYNYRQLNARR